jgi:hypothetical protein
MADEAIDQLGIADAHRLEHLRIHADVGEARQRSDLDDQLAVLAQKEVDAGQALAAQRPERLDRELAHLVAEVAREIGRDLHRGPGSVEARRSCPFASKLKNFSRAPIAADFVRPPAMGRLIPISKPPVVRHRGWQRAWVESRLRSRTSLSGTGAANKDGDKRQHDGMEGHVSADDDLINDIALMIYDVWGLP